MIRFYCARCGCLVAVIKTGSKLKKELVFLCETCYSALNTGNIFSEIFGGKK